MKETIVQFFPGKRPFKKYTVHLKNKISKKIRTLHFGDTRYQQYKDRTPLGIFSNKNHNNIQRMRRYFLRHSGTSKRSEAIAKEKKSGYYTPKLLSHLFLW